MAFHPHGIMSMGAFVNFSTEATGFSQLFPGITPYLLTLAGTFSLPFGREYLFAVGKRWTISDFDWWPVFCHSFIKTEYAQTSLYKTFNCRLICSIDLSLFRSYMMRDVQRQTGCESFPHTKRLANFHQITLSLDK